MSIRLYRLCRACVAAFFHGLGFHMLGKDFKCWVFSVFGECLVDPQTLTPETLNPKPDELEPEIIALFSLNQGVFLCTLRVCTLGFGSLNRGIWPLD